MTDQWYYAEGDQSRGPVSLAQLVALLAKIPDPRRVMIWRHGFENWKPMEDVREIAERVFRPPPLPTSQAPMLPAPPPLAPVIREPVAIDTDDSEYFKKKSTTPLPFGGWLYLLGLGQIMGILRFISGMKDYYGGLDQDLVNKFPAALYGEVLMNVFVFILAIFTTCLFFRKSHRFRRFLGYQYALVILIPLIGSLWVGITLGMYTGRPMTEFITFDAKDAAQISVGMISALIWMPYIYRSKRAAATFIK
jgi:hypothetical protein